MNFPSDTELLSIAAQRLGVTAEILFQRYYGSPGDARHELDEFNRCGRLQPSLAELLRQELDLSPAAEDGRGRRLRLRRRPRPRAGAGRCARE